VGIEYRTLVVAALILAVFLFVLICFLSMCSGYRKGPDEDDGFWEVYNLYWRVHTVITLFLFVILVLWIPALYEFIMVTLTTMEEVDFFKE